MSDSSDSRRILLATGSALLLAVTLLVTAILPAEYGWDPLGTGAAMGLLGISGGDNSALQQQGQAWRSDKIAFQLAPFEAVEYKYRLEEGDSLLFQWRADAEVLFDMHAEPDGAAPGYSESFSKSRGSGSSGRYTAPFTGVHGWYWQNRGENSVTVTLRAVGFFDGATEYRDDREFHYDFDSPPAMDTQP